MINKFFQKMLLQLEYNFVKRFDKIKIRINFYQKLEFF